MNPGVALSLESAVMNLEQLYLLERSVITGKFPRPLENSEKAWKLAERTTQTLLDNRKKLTPKSFEKAKELLTASWGMIPTVSGSVMVCEHLYCRRAQICEIYCRLHVAHHNPTAYLSIQKGLKQWHKELYLKSLKSYKTAEETLSTAPGLDDNIKKHLISYLNIEIIEIKKNTPQTEEVEADDDSSAAARKRQRTASPTKERDDASATAPAPMGARSALVWMRQDAVGASAAASSEPAGAGTGGDGSTAPPPERAEADTRTTALRFGPPGDFDYFDCNFLDLTAELNWDNDNDEKNKDENASLG
jgi:hypothetical protein